MTSVDFVTLSIFFLFSVMSCLCHIFLAKISHTESDMYLLYEKFAVLWKSTLAMLEVGCVVRGHHSVALPSTSAGHCSQRQKKIIADKAISLKIGSVFLFVEDRTKSPSEKTAALCRE